MSQQKKYLKYWRSILVILGILYLSFAPPSTFKEVPTFHIEHLDKIIHLFLYSVLTISLILDFRKNKTSNTLSLVFVFSCLLFPVFLGGLVEILQPMYFAPRTAEWGDWFSDISGVLLGWLIVNIFKLKRSGIYSK